MQLPKGIVSANKIRDYHICRLYLDGLLPEEIKSERNLQNIYKTYTTNSLRKL